MHESRLANARSVRNELDRARLRHAHRLAASPDRSWGRDDLMRIEPADILGDDAAPSLAQPSLTAGPGQLSGGDSG